MSILRTTNRMSLGFGFDLQMLTTIFIGLLMVAIGLYIHRYAATGSDGFQSVSTTDATPVISPPPPPPPPTKILSSISEETFKPIPEHEQLTRKVSEIQTMMNTISLSKPKHDLTLATILDNELLITLDTLYNEVSFFDDSTRSVELDVFIQNMNTFDTLTDTQKGVIRTMVTVAYQEASVLYYIYVSLPAMIVSTGLVVNTDTATKESITDPTVTKQLQDTITNMLAGIPKLSVQLESALKKLTPLINDFAGVNLTSRDYIATLDTAFRNYYRLVDIKVQSLKKQIALKKAKISSNVASGTAAMNGIAEASQGVVLIVETVKTFIQNALDVIQPISDKVDATLKENGQMSELLMLKNTITTAVQTLNLTKTSIGYSSTIGIPISIQNGEGFASEMNPYDTPSLNIKQAHDFRLEKRGLIKDVLSNSRM